ncbi:hypothetical protein KP509_12G085200 [Ceratopteris richardii]|uniref:Uncharacterized protein n=1 Tax=Ceratopteris richardii TaxID=49495 RepID=A0A8T2TKS8_CERRI|nr:hypothetical protein KP509_12G085200 [Ceratopteris richardii]
MAMSHTMKHSRAFRQCLPSSTTSFHTGCNVCPERQLRCLQATEVKSAGPVLALTICNGLLYSICQSGALETWTELGLHPASNRKMWTGMASASTTAMAVVSDKSGDALIATAHKDFKIRLMRTSGSHVMSIKSSGVLPPLYQYIHNWAIERRYVQSWRHGKKRAWMEHTDTISAVAFSADRNLLYSASWDRTVKVWNLKEMRCAESFKAHTDSINAMIVSADGLVFTGSADKSIKVWSRRRAAPAMSARGRNVKHSMVAAFHNQQDAAVNALVMSSDGQFLYSGCSDGQIIVWRRSSLGWRKKSVCPSELLRAEEKLHGHARAILCMDILQTKKESSKDSWLLFSGSADKTVRIWRCMERISSQESGAQAVMVHECIAVMKGHSGPVRSLRVDELQRPCAGVAFTGGLDGRIIMWMISIADDADRPSMCSSMFLPDMKWKQN